MHINLNYRTMVELMIKIKNELGKVDDHNLIKVLKRHPNTQQLRTKRVNGSGHAVNLYCFNGIYVISDEKSGESYRIALTERQNIAYQIHKQEMLYVKSMISKLE